MATKKKAAAGSGGFQIHNKPGKGRVAINLATGTAIEELDTAKRFRVTMNGNGHDIHSDSTLEELIAGGGDAEAEE